MDWTPVVAIYSRIGVLIFTECCIMATIDCAIMIGHGAQVVIAWIVHSSHRQRHVITYVELMDRKAYEILDLPAGLHRGGEIEFKSANKMRKKT